MERDKTMHLLLKLGKNVTKKMKQFAHISRFDALVFKLLIYSVYNSNLSNYFVASILIIISKSYNCGWSRALSHPLQFCVTLLIMLSVLCPILYDYLQKTCFILHCQIRSIPPMWVYCWEILIHLMLQSNTDGFKRSMPFLWFSN